MPYQFNVRRILSYTRRAVDDYKMIEEGDRIAVGVSGGKDSLTLLCAMANLKKFYPNVYNKIKRDHAEHGLAGLRYALDRCMEEGYLDPTVDIELMARLFLSTSGTLLSEE